LEFGDKIFLLAAGHQPGPGKKLSFVKGDGTAGKVEIENDRFTLPIGGRPKYIVLGDRHFK
jgi:hypothetical protein